MTDRSGGRYVDPTAKIGVPYRFLQGCTEFKDQLLDSTVVLPKRVYVGPFVIIGANVALGEQVVIDAFCSIEQNSKIGRNTLLIYRAMVGGDSIIGDDCVIGGFIPENCRIGDRCRIFGNIVHTHSDTTMSWDHHEVPEPSVVVHEDSFVGFGATLIGGFEVGPRSYICAGAVVTKTVPPYHIASGTNQIVHYTEWKGSLKNNPVFIQKE